LRTGGTTHLSPEETSKALAAIPPGEQIVYAVGDVRADCTALDAAELREVRALVWDAMRKGKVALTQRRIGEARFEYRALRKRITPAQECGRNFGHIGVGSRAWQT
jgi:hypothetical protein